MTKTNMVALLKMIYISYPNSGITPSEDRVSLWQELLYDIPDDILVTATKQVMKESEYAPTIASIRKEAVAMVNKASGETTASEAWELALKAIRRFGYMQELAALESMPEDAAQITRQMGWRNLCMTEESMIGVARGQFIKAYEQLMERKKKEMQTPDGFKKALATLVAEQQRQLAEVNAE